VRRITDTIKPAFKNAAGLSCFLLFRGLERHWSPATFYSVLQPFFLARAALNTIFKKSKFRPLPDFLSRSRTVRSVTHERAGHYLNHILEFFPERLSEPKWMNRCRIEGLEYLSGARQKNRPVILAFCHFGAYYVFRYWLRAAGYPVATFIGGHSPNRIRLKQLQDSHSPDEHVAVAFYQNQLRETAEFLSGGNILLMAIDAPGGKQTNIPFGDGWNFQMSTGAVRLAQHHRAPLIPCSIRDEGHWNFQITLGPPVPEQFISEPDGYSAGKYLIEQMIPEFQTHPDQCSADLTRCLKPDPSVQNADEHSPCLPFRAHP
jgi:lauroyl/myristoyl acyltransferase